MAVYKGKNKTTDGRSWFYSTYKKDFNGNSIRYKSKRYLTKSEAQQAERLFLMKRDNPINKPFILIAEDYFNELLTTEFFSSGLFNYIKFLKEFQGFEKKIFTFLKKIFKFLKNSSFFAPKPPFQRK